MGTEEWTAIKDFEGLYEVSTFGRIKSFKHNKSVGKILKPGFVGMGYVHVCLHKAGKCYGKLVHRIVAEAFIPNPDGKPEVNHIDGNKLNNHVENLEWVTSKENQNHSLELGLRKRSQLNGGNCVHVTKYVNDKLDEIVAETGAEKWAIVNELLLKALVQAVES